MESPCGAAMNHRPELELLLCCARTDLSQNDRNCIQSLLCQELDWEFLLQQSARHGVMPLLYWSLKQIDSAVIPLEFLNALQIRFQENAQQNMLLTQELVLLLKQFRQQGISVLTFKGTSLAFAIYGNLALRQITDLDILVHKQDYPKALDLLVAQGYQLRVQVPWETHLTRNNSLYNVDLHSSIAPAHLSHPLRSTDVWQNLEPLQFAGTTMLTLPPEMHLLVLCLHGTKDCWSRLNRICDISELIRTQSLDWQTLMKWSDVQGWRRLIGLGLVLAQDLLNTEVPNDVQRWIAVEQKIPRLVHQVKHHLFSEMSSPIDEVERTLFHVRTRERFQDKAFALRGLMQHSGWLSLTPNDQAFIKLPSGLTFLYYLIRPIRVLGKYWGVIQKRFGMK
jgi:hypothetical protein